MHVPLFSMPMNLPPEKFKSRLSNSSLNTLKWAMAHLPLWFISLVLNGLFSIALIGLKGLKKVCLRNLQSVYQETKTPQEYKAMTEGCIKNIGYSMTDMLYYAQRPEKLSRILSIENEDCLIRALEKGRGVIAVTAHLGNFPLMFLSLVRRGYQVNVIIRPMRNQAFGRFMDEMCAQWNINMIRTQPPRNFLKETLGALKRNELLFILLDEEAREDSGVLVDFLNSRVSRAAGPMLFHQRAGSPVMPVFIVKEEKNFRIFIEPELTVEDRFSAMENNTLNISALTRVIETYVKKYPQQWGGWLNKRWTTS